MSTLQKLPVVGKGRHSNIVGSGGRSNGAGGLLSDRPNVCRQRNLGIFPSNPSQVDDLIGQIIHPGIVLLGPFAQGLFLSIPADILGMSPVHKILIERFNWFQPCNNYLQSQKASNSQIEIGQHNICLNEICSCKPCFLENLIGLKNPFVQGNVFIRCISLLCFHFCEYLIENRQHAVHIDQREHGVIL